MNNTNNAGEALDLNKSRTEFEAEIRKLNPDISLERWSAGHYKHNAVDGYWRGWQLALARAGSAAPAAAVQPSQQDARIAALRAALLEISETRFGYDGDCGTTRIADDALYADEQAAATPEQSDTTKGQA